MDAAVLRFAANTALAVYSAVLFVDGFDPFSLSVCSIDCACSHRGAIAHAVCSAVFNVYVQFLAESISMMDTSTDNVFDLVLAVHVVTPRYL